MALRDFLLDIRKKWLNGRCENLKVDGTLTIVNPGGTSQDLIAKELLMANTVTAAPKSAEVKNVVLVFRRVGKMVRVTIPPLLYITDNNAVAAHLTIDTAIPAEWRPNIGVGQKLSMPAVVFVEDATSDEIAGYAQIDQADWKIRFFRGQLGATSQWPASALGTQFGTLHVINLDWQLT